MKLSNIPKRRLWIAAGVVLLILVALPGVIVIRHAGGLGDLFDHHAGGLADLFDRHALSITRRDGSSTYHVGSDMPVRGETLRATIDGDVVFAADERSLARLGKGAVFEVEQRRAGVLRSLRMTADAKGVRKVYTVDGVAKPFDAAAEAWLAEVIPDLYRLSGLDAEARTARLLSAGGVPRLLEEIGKIPGDGVRAEYLVQLFAQAKPDQAQTAQVMNLLRAIDSDYDKRRALNAALTPPEMTPEQQAALLSIAAGMESDYERAEWLIAAADELPFSGPTAASWSQALQGIDSDYERRRALEAAFVRGVPREQAVALALRAMRGMESDYERRSALQAAAATGVALPDAEFFAATDAIASDYEKREALVALIAAAAPDIARSHAILRSARTIESHYERGQVLFALAAEMPNDAQLIEAYRTVARSMSDHERGEAEKALDRFARL